MAATTYDGPSKYLPYTYKDGKGGCGCGGEKKHHDHPEGCGCDECKPCGCKDKECGCCPPGLVGIYDDKGNHVGCLTPNDAELFVANSVQCTDGYAKLFSAAGKFLGCVSEGQFAALYSAVNQ